MLSVMPQALAVNVTCLNPVAINFKELNYMMRSVFTSIAPPRVVPTTDCWNFQLTLNLSIYTPTSSASVHYYTNLSEQAVHNQVNQYCASRGLPPWLWYCISEPGAGLNGAVLSWYFTQRVQTISKWFLTVGCWKCSHSQGYGDPATQAVQGWLHWSSHEHWRSVTWLKLETQNSWAEYYFTQILSVAPPHLRHPLFPSLVFPHSLYLHYCTSTYFRVLTTVLPTTLCNSPLLVLPLTANFTTTLAFWHQAVQSGSTVPVSGLPPLSWCLH